MKVLVTGGLGFIGSHTVVKLIENGDEVVIVDNLYNSKLEVKDRIKEITGVECPTYVIDVQNKEELTKVFKEHRVDAVIHFAGYKAVGESCVKPLEYYDNNLNSTLVLLEVMRDYKVHNFVFSSSATVYGEPQRVPMYESDPVVEATSPYGETKVMIERILKDYAKVDKEFNCALLRYFNPIGAHESGRIGENPNGIPNNLMPYITQVAVGKLKCLGVFGNDYPTHDGTGVRDFIHVVDLAKGHVKAIDYADAHKGAEVFNLGTGTGYSVLDIVNAFQKVNGVEIPYEIKPRRPGDIAECYADPKKAYEGLGWKAEKTLEDMCRDSWHWQSSNPNGYEA